MLWEPEFSSHCKRPLWLLFRFSDQRGVNFPKRLHVLQRTPNDTRTNPNKPLMIYVTVSMKNLFSLFLVDGSPVSVRRYKAIFEQDQLSAERAREPGNNLKTIVNSI